MKYTLDIIYPVYHEEGNIEKVIRDVRKYSKTSSRLLFIYQDPVDPTVSVIKKLQKEISGLVIIKSKYGVGIMPALKTGFEYIKANTVLIMMADLSDNSRDIDRMVRLIEKGYDLVCASRYSLGGKRVAKASLKGYLSYLACITLKIITGVPTNDATNAFKCFKRKTLTDIKVQSQKGFEFPLELTVKSFYSNKKIAEIPTIWKDRMSGESKFMLHKEIPYYLKWYIFAIKKRFSF